MIVTAPIYNQVQQRDNSNRADVLVEGFLISTASFVQCRFVPMKVGQGIETPWEKMPVTSQNFSGRIVVGGGWYELQVVADTQEYATVPNVGVGEVFVVMGHSVAQGSSYSIDGATDPRVVCGPINAPGPALDRYNQTGKADDLPPFGFVAYRSGVLPGPFGSNTHFWALFGQTLAQRENVPVCLFNAAFGGTSLEHWGKSARGESFVHSFVNSSIRMPYINLYNALTKYVGRLGCRAILSDQGQNDWQRTDYEQVFQDYASVISYLRIDSGLTELAVIVNRQTPFHRETNIRAVQERVIREIPNCFAGPDYDTGIAVSERDDDVHLNLAGERTAAGLWANALSPALLDLIRPGTVFPVPVTGGVPTTPLLSNSLSGIDPNDFVGTPQTTAIGPAVWVLVGLAVLAIGVAFVLSFTKKMSF